MKKTIVVVAILAMVLITMMGSVNAASVTAKTEVEQGETVTVTVNMAATSAVQFEMSYDNTKFEFVGASAGALGTDVGAANGGVVNVAAFATNGTSTTETVTVTFKALETTDAKNFTVSGLVTESGETIANPTVAVEVTAPIDVKPGTNEEEQNPTTPSTSNGQQGTTTSTNNEQQKTTTTESQSANGKVGTDGKVITKLPQTGTPVYIGVATIIAIAGVALVVRKAK